MSGLLVAGKIQTLLDRLTAVRAGYLDAAISSRASAANLTTLSSDVATVDANVDAIKAVTDGLGVPLTMVGLRTSQVSIGATFDALAATGTVSVGAVQNTWYTVTSASADGVLFGATLYVADTVAQDYQYRVVIDGTTVFTSATNFWKSGDGLSDGVAICGRDSTNGAGGIPRSLRFTTSFSLDARCTSSSTAIDFNSRVGYYTVS